MQKTAIKDYVGSYLYLGAAMDKLATTDPTRLPDPSFAQIRAAGTEYCALPLVSSEATHPAPSRHASRSVAVASAPISQHACGDVQCRRRRWRLVEGGGWRVADDG